MSACVIVFIYCSYLSFEFGWHQVFADQCAWNRSECISLRLHLMVNNVTIHRVLQRSSGEMWDFLVGMLSFFSPPTWDNLNRGEHVKMNSLERSISLTRQAEMNESHVPLSSRLNSGVNVQIERNEKRSIVLTSSSSGWRMDRSPNPWLILSFSPFLFIKNTTLVVNLLPHFIIRLSLPLSSSTGRRVSQEVKHDLSPRRTGRSNLVTSRRFTRQFWRRWTRMSSLSWRYATVFPSTSLDLRKTLNRIGEIDRRAPRRSLSTVWWTATTANHPRDPTNVEFERQRQIPSRTNRPVQSASLRTGSDWP